MGYLSKNNKVTKIPNGIKPKSVFSKLIRKAERKKMSAENYRVYAMLQSTIDRLKQDNIVFNTKYIHRKEDNSQNNSSLEGGCGLATSDILVDLDDFFNKLKCVGSNR